MSSSLTLTEQSQTCVIHEDGTKHLRVPTKGTAVCFVEITSQVTSTEIIINAEEASTLDCIVLVSGEGSSCAKVQLRSTVKSNGVIRWHCVATAHRSSDVVLTSTLSGADAESTINAVFFASDSATHSLKARNIFAAPRGSGEMTLRGIAEGHGTATIDGMIEITEQGQGTETYLTEDVLKIGRAHV